MMLYRRTEFPLLRAQKNQRERDRKKSKQFKNQLEIKLKVLPELVRFAKKLQFKH